MEILVFIALGLVAGFFAGLLGVGGGIVTVPVMSLWLLPYFQFPASDVVHIAIASSLLAIIPTSVMSTYGHHKQGGILWPLAMRFTPGLILGSVLGAFLATKVAGYNLQVVFGLFLVIVALYMMKSPQGFALARGNKNIKFPFISLPIGAISAALGVGGGTMTVPYLLWRGKSIQQAIGVSAYCGLPIALASSFTFLIVDSVDSNQFSAGFIHIPAVVGISVGSILFAPVGAYCTHHWPVVSLKRIFALVLLLASGRLLGVY